MHLPKFLCAFAISASLHAAGITVTDSPGADDFIMANGKTVTAIFIETNAEPAVARAAVDLAGDFARVTGAPPRLENNFSAAGKIGVIIGTIGKSQVIDRLAAEDQLAEVVISVLFSHVDALGSITAVGLVTAIPRPGVFRTPPRWVAEGVSTFFPATPDSIDMTAVVFSSLFGPSEPGAAPTMPSADFWVPFSSPLSADSSFRSRFPDLPGYSALTSTLITATYTARLSGQE